MTDARHEEEMRRQQLSMLRNEATRGNLTPRGRGNLVGKGHGLNATTYLSDSVASRPSSCATIDEDSALDLDDEDCVNTVVSGMSSSRLARKKKQSIKTRAVEAMLNEYQENEDRLRQQLADMEELLQKGQNTKMPKQSAAASWRHSTGSVAAARTRSTAEVHTVRDDLKDHLDDAEASVLKWKQEAHRLRESLKETQYGTGPAVHMSKELEEREQRAQQAIEAASHAVGLAESAADEDRRKLKTAIKDLDARVRVCRTASGFSDYLEDSKDEDWPTERALLVEEVNLLKAQLKQMNDKHFMVTSTPPYEAQRKPTHLSEEHRTTDQLQQEDEPLAETSITDEIWDRLSAHFRRALCCSMRAAPDYVDSDHTEQEHGRETLGFPGQPEKYQ